MIIDNETHKLSTENYIPVKTKKNRIVLANTFNHDMGHVMGWKNRLNGYFKKTATYTINKNGVIYEHFNPDFFSHYFQSHEMNMKTIIVLIENEGWLVKDKNNQYINLLGNIYRKPNEVYEKKWRGFNFWSPYTKEQLEASVYLVNMLCEKYGIVNKTVSHNTKIDLDISPYGVFYRSNLEKYYTDVNPNWFFEEFKTKLENYEQRIN